MTGTKLTSEDVAAAERLLGLEFTAEERAQMLDNLDGQVGAARSIRAMPTSRWPRPCPASAPTGCATMRRVY